MAVAESTPAPPNKASRILAALDNPARSPPPAPAPALQTPARRNRLFGLSTPDAGPSSQRNSTLLQGNERPPLQAGEVQNAAAMDILAPPRSSAVFNLNYDHKTPVGRMDVGGPDQAQRMADFVTRSMDNLSHGINVMAALEKLGLNNKQDFIPGLEVKLMGHQTIGVAWMVAQEKEPRHKGGILADDMGLGKTVQMIATMVVNQPDMDDPCHTTLVVVPAALLLQWKDEIETKTNNLFTVHIHHGKDKLKSIEQVQNYDCIITTYQTLCMEFACPKDLEEDDHEDWLAENGGVLARMKWFRAISDESQYIRNRGTRASKCMAMIRAKYRWMLTGTPVTNTLADIYGLLRFGRHRPWNDWADFKEHIVDMQTPDPPLAGTRAQAILAPILLRRTKDSTLEGQPILELPPKHIEFEMLDFSEDERNIYDAFEAKTQMKINKFIRQGTLLKNHAFVLVLILRLRQCCAHPNLILEGTEGFDDPTLALGTADEKEYGRAEKAMGKAWAQMIKARFLRRARAEVDDDEEGDADPEASCPVCSELYLSENGRVLHCGHEICFDCALELANAPILHDGIFGQGSDQENERAEKAFEVAAANGQRPCPTCKKMQDLTAEKMFKSSAFVPTEEELEQSYNPTFIKAAAHSKVKSEVKRAPVKFEDALLSDSDDDIIDMGALCASPIPGVKKEEKNVKVKKRSFLSDSDDDVKPSIKLDIKPRMRKRAKVEPAENLIEISSDDDDKPPAKKEKPFPDFVKKEPSQDKIKGEHKSPSASPRPSQQQNNRKAKTKGKVSAVDLDHAFATWRKGDQEVEPSTKMVKMIELLQEWDAIGDKSIVFSQWTSMLDLVKTILGRHGIRILRYDGKMDRGSREEALSIFKKPGGPKVILISTKSGGVGLNLISANRIVNLDTSWNYASESQAYDRVHRMGQEKEVFIKRLIVKDTIEERMLKLQDVKTGLAEAALGEGTGTKLNKLSIKDIQHLFGMNKPENDPNQRRLASQEQD